MFDQNFNRFVRKMVFSYGWITNEIGDWNGDTLNFDVVSVDGEPEFFKGLRWRSFIRKYSDDEIGSGLQMARKGEDFRLYGETRAKRIKP